jgi:hypothetical protein
MKLPRRMIKIVSDQYKNGKVATASVVSNTRSQSLLLSRNEESINNLKEKVLNR